jgi:hypothetical protein
MSQDARPPAQALIRRRFDFTTTFDLFVGPCCGEETRFTVDHDLLTSRSGLLLEARISKPQEPVHISNTEPEVFTLYLNCIHSGMEAIRAGGELLGTIVTRKSPQSDDVATSVEEERGTDEDSEEGSNEGSKGCSVEGSEESSEDDASVSAGVRFEALIKLHILAGELQDLAMANLATDEIVRMVEEDGWIPTEINVAYNSMPSCPLRDLFRDIYIHKQVSWNLICFLIDEEPTEVFSEFLRDIALECLTLKYRTREDANVRVSDVFGKSIAKDMCADKCHYHLHDEKHPRCVPEPSG